MYLRTPRSVQQGENEGIAREIASREKELMLDGMLDHMEDDGIFFCSLDDGLGTDGGEISNELGTRTQQKKKIIERLKERLLEEMEDDEDFAANRIDKLGVNGRELSSDRWDEVAEELNEIAEGFYNKTGKQWKDYYTKWRLAVKGTINDYLTEIKRTGNKPPVTDTPDDMSWRIANIYGWEGTGMDIIPESGIFAHDRGSIKRLQAIFSEECKKRCPKQQQKAKRLSRKRNHEKYNQYISSCNDYQTGSAKKRRGTRISSCMEPRDHASDDLPSLQHNYRMCEVYDAAVEELTKEAEGIQSLSKATDELTRTTLKDIDLLRSLCILRGIQIE